MFNDTILYNITYGRVDATEEEVEHGVYYYFSCFFKWLYYNYNENVAARLAQIHDFIISLPEGYQTKGIIYFCFLCLFFRFLIFLLLSGRTRPEAEWRRETASGYSQSYPEGPANYDIR